MKRTKEDQLQGRVCVCELHLLLRTSYSPKPFFVWKERKPYLCPQHYESES